MRKTCDIEALECGQNSRKRGHCFIPYLDQAAQLGPKILECIGVEQNRKFTRKPLVADRVTYEKGTLKYARILVDMKLNGEFP